MTRCWHLIWNSRQLWLFFTFVIFHQAAEDQCDKNTNVKSWAHWDNSVHVKILWKKDSESYNYCSINIGTKLNLYISVDHSVMLPQIVLEEKKKKYILVFHTMCVVPKRMTVWFISEFTIQERLWCIWNLLGQWEENHAGDYDERLTETLHSNSSFKNVFSCLASVPPHMCPLVSNRSL